MKKIFVYTILPAIVFLAGCNKWLDVKPQGQSTEDEMFETQRGFRDALTGAYVRLKNGNLYGGNMMWGTIEWLACNWDLPTSSSSVTIPRLKAADYTDQTVRGWMDDIYEAQYKAIADVNAILEKIDGKRAIFSDRNFEIVKGEALALRAFCHFDVLRMFGPMPQNPGSEPILPYVKAVNTNIHPQLTYQEFTAAILSDLDEAEALLRDVDPVTKYSLAELNPSSSDATPPVEADNYFMYRQVRLNYYAVLALKARVYLWLVSQGDVNRVNAAKYARMVIDARDHSGTPTFRLGEQRDRVAGDYTMSPEHIMAVSVYDLAATAEGLFGERGSLMRYDFNVSDGFYYLNNLFPVNERVSDVRWNGMWVYKTGSGNTNYVMYNKYIQRSGSPVLQVPLLRLSEMYLILTECAETKAEAETPYTAFCEKKGIPFNGFNNSDWLNDRRNKLIREYVREFYAEGQSLFTYKRFNVTALPASWTYTYFTGSPARYIVPKPDREVNYNNK